MTDLTTTSASTSSPEGDASATPVTSAKTALADAIRTHFSGDAPLIDKAKGFAKERPWASAALLGVAALAVFNTLRGRR